MAMVLELYCLNVYISLKFDWQKCFFFGGGGGGGEKLECLGGSVSDCLDVVFLTDVM